MLEKLRTYPENNDNLKNSSPRPNPNVKMKMKI